MERFRAKLERGGRVEMVVLGDSIARGNDATIPSRSFVSLWADELHERYGSQVIITNHSYGGWTIRDAHMSLKRIGSALADHDLVVLAVGVNDATTRLSIREFSKTLAKIAVMCERAGVDLIAITPLPPANADVAPYVAALRDHVRTADVYGVWGDTALANGVNHPSDDGHALYARVLTEATVHQSAPAFVVTPDRVVP